MCYFCVALAVAGLLLFADVPGADAQLAALAELQIGGPLPRQLAVRLHAQPLTPAAAETHVEHGHVAALMALMFGHLANLGFGMVHGQGGAYDSADSGKRLLTTVQSNLQQVSTIVQPILRIHGSRHTT